MRWSPGKDATDAISRPPTISILPGEFGARLRLTGPVPIAIRRIRHVRMARSSTDRHRVGGVLILWMALHSAKIISAVFLNLFIGLSITTAAGLWMVGSLTCLSIAFAFCSSDWA